MKRKKGFTLIELLAVIVILAIIALISTPIIIGVIEKARKGAFEDSAYGVLDAGRVYYLNQLMDENKFSGKKFEFTKKEDIKLLKLAGEPPAGGVLVLDINGKEEMAIYDKDKRWCATKGKDDTKVSVVDYKKSECDSTSESTPAPTLKPTTSPTPPPTGSDALIDKNTPGNKDGLYTDDFGNTRYKGKNPNNYVTLGDAEWRIIGILNGRIKLIYYQTGAGGQYSTVNSNNWSKSSMNTVANTTFYNQLNDEVKSMIDTVTYKTGGFTHGTEIGPKLTKKEMYVAEQGDQVYSGNAKTWTGKVAIMYASDYAYGADPDGTTCFEETQLISYQKCAGVNWLYPGYWTEALMTASRSNGTDVTFMYESGHVAIMNAGKWYSARPVIFLKETVKIVSGDGTSSNPYQFSL